MTDNPVIRVVTQRHSHDCGVAVLAMLLGVSYEEALVVVSHESPLVLSQGVYERHLKAAAARLGVTLVSRRRYDIEEDFGILGISSPKWKTDHVVILKSGLIVETDGCLWEADVFLRHHQAKPGVLLVTKE